MVQRHAPARAVQVGADPAAAKLEPALLALRLPKQKIQEGDCWKVNQGLPVLTLQVNLDPSFWVRTPVTYCAKTVSSSTATIEARAIAEQIWPELNDLLEHKFWGVKPELSAWSPRGAEVYEAVFEVDLNSHRILGARADLSAYYWFETNRYHFELDSMNVCVSSRRLTAGSLDK